jgi:hypothetical protein
VIGGPSLCQIGTPSERRREVRTPEELPRTIRSLKRTGALGTPGIFLSQRRSPEKVKARITPEVSTAKRDESPIIGGVSTGAVMRTIHWL